MPNTSTAARAAIRLSSSDLQRINTITEALSHPLRTPPGITEVLRFALDRLARDLAASGLPR